MATGGIEGLEVLLRDVVRRHRLPGLSIAVNRAGRELFADGLGYADLERSRRVTPDTLFGVASVTKLATAIMVMLLRQQGRLSISDPLAKYFPALVYAEESRVRLHHLLSHSAGFPGLPCRFRATDIADPDNRSGGVEGMGTAAGAELGGAEGGILVSDDLVAMLNRLEFMPLAPPGELLSYSNESYCLLGGVIEALLARPYREVLERAVFRPLGMTRSLVGGQDLRRFADVATPLGRGADGLHPVGIWEAPIFYPAGGVISTARDLVRLIDALDKDTGLLASDHAGLMASARMPVASRPWATLGYGYGLEYERLDSDNTLVWHSGQRAGVSSFVARLLEQRLSVALICNLGGVPLATIGHGVIAHVIDRRELAWPPVFARGAQCGQDTTRFAGCYGSREGFEFSVETRRGKPILLSRSGRHPLAFVEADSGTVAGQTFRFLVDDGGAPWALALDLRIFPRCYANSE